MRHGRLAAVALFLALCAASGAGACAGDGAAAGRPDGTDPTDGAALHDAARTDVADAADAAADARGDGAGDTAADAGPPVPLFDDANVTWRYCATDEAAVSALYEALTPRQRIGQHVIIGVDRVGDGPSPAARALLEEFAIGNVFLGPPNGIALHDPLQTARFVHSLKELIGTVAGAPPFVALDQEGGPNAVLNRVTGGTDTIGSLPIGATRDPQVAFEQFALMGREVHALGFNMDFGPVLDTLHSTRNGNLNTRPFGPDPQLNAQLGRAAVAGLQSERVIAMAKHFPGDGALGGNTHREEITVPHDRAWLDAQLLLPFRAVLAAGAGGDGVMTIPERYAALDPERSAITSRAITTDLLRGEYGFEGLVVTDALGMAGVRIGLAPEDDAGLESLRAGADLLLYVVVPRDELAALYDRVEAALADGSLSAAEFEASTKRILRYKQRYCLFEEPTHPDPAAPEAILGAVGRAEDDAASRAHAERAVVLVHDDGTLPLTGRRVVYAGPGPVYQDPGSGWPNVVDRTLGDALRGHDEAVAVVTYLLPLNVHQAWSRIRAAAADTDAEVLVLGTLHARFDVAQQQLVAWLLEDPGLPLVHVMLGVPFDYLQTRDRAAAAVAAMSNRSGIVDATAALLYGALEPRGTLAWDLSTGSMGGPDGGPPGGSGEDRDRCVEEDVVCSNDGFCVDTGERFGCVCQPNWHASEDGRDCLPDGQEG